MDGLWSLLEGSVGNSARMGAYVRKMEERDGAQRRAMRAICLASRYNNKLMGRYCARRITADMCPSYKNAIRFNPLETSERKPTGEVYAPSAFGRLYYVGDFPDSHAYCATNIVRALYFGVSAENRLNMNRHRMVFAAAGETPNDNSPLYACRICILLGCVAFCMYLSRYMPTR